MAAVVSLPGQDLNRVAVLVLGMHRSGTSALTWLLGRLGAALPADGIAGGSENSRGYFESAGLVAADDRLIRAAGSSWFDPRALDLDRMPAALRDDRIAAVRDAIAAGWSTAALIAIKDPRICRFVPTIAALLRDGGIVPRAVLMLRDAGEVAASLAARDATTPACALLLWLRHMLDAERGSRDMPRAIVSYDALLANWRGLVAGLAPLLGHDGLFDAAQADEIDAFLDPALRHHRAAATPSVGPLDALVAAAERGFAALRQADDADARAALDAVAAALDAAPWIEGDIVHDELRHRRAPAAPGKPTPVSPTPEPPARPAAAPSPPPPISTSRADEVRLIRESGLFDADWYRATYPDVAASGVDPVLHYLETGAAEGRDPNPLFNTAYYARQMARRA